MMFLPERLESRAENSTQFHRTADKKKTKYPPLGTDNPATGGQ
jgi:hypothetical protein